MERLAGFLKSDADGFEQLGGSGQSPAKVREQLTAPKKLAHKFSSLPSGELRDLLSSFLRRIVVGEEQIRVMVGRNNLCRLLRNGGKSNMDKLNEARTPVTPSDLICLSIDARLKRYGGVVHLVVSAEPYGDLGFQNQALTSEIHGASL